MVRQRALISKILISVVFLIVLFLFFSSRSLAAGSDTIPISNVVVHYTAQIVSGDENQIWSQPYPVTGSTWVASAKSYNGQYVNIVREARTSTGTYEQFRVNGQTIGWLDRKAFQSFADDTYADNPVNLIGQVIPGNGNQVWSQPYDVRGSTWTANQSSFSGQWVKIVREAQTIRGTYYQFEVNGRVIGWMDKSAFQSVNDNTYSAQEVHYTAQIKSGNGNQVWAAPFPIDGGTWVANQSSFNGQWIRIINQATTPAGKYYQFQANGRTIGWMDTNAFQPLANDTYYNNAINYVGKVISGNGNQVWSEPYDVRGSTWTANQSSFSGQWVKIVREAQTIRGTYYQFEVNGRVIGWMDKSAFQPVNNNAYSPQEVHYTAEIKSGNGNQVWAVPFPIDGGTWVANQSSFNGQWIRIINQAVTPAGKYYQFQANGRTIGWMDTNAFQSLANDTYYNNAVNYVGKVISGNGNQVWSEPFDVRGSAWTANQSSFPGRWVKIIREAQTVRGTYYQFEENGRVIGWMDKSAFQSVSNNTYSPLEVHYTAQIKSGDGNQVWASPFPIDGGTWVANQSSFNGQWIRIINQAATPAGKYYQFQANSRTIGWMDTNAFQSLANDTYYNNAVNYVGKVTSGNGNQVWSEPFDVRGSAWTANQSSFANQWVHIIREAKTVRGIYYQFQSNNRTIGWMDKNAFSSVGNNSYTSVNTSYSTFVRSDNSNQIWSMPFPVTGSTWIASAGQYNNSWVTVISEAQTYLGTYCRIKINGHTIGWIDKKALFPDNALETGVDIASYQHDSPINFYSVKQSGISFVIVKSSEGTSYTNPFFLGDVAAAKSAGLKTNAYHFFRASNSTAAKREADIFASQIKKAQITGYAFVDVETTNGSSRSTLTNSVNVFLRELKNQGISKIGIYSGKSFYDNSLYLSSIRQSNPGLLVWTAWYSNTNPNTDLWQFSDAGKINGITGSVDLNFSYSYAF